MSKAFKKDDDGGDDDSVDSGEEGALPQGFKNYMTPQCYEKLKEEVKALLYDERPKIVAVIHWAAGNGDRSENGDYIYGKRKLREIDRRVRFLNKRLDAAEIVDPSTQKSDRVLFGATVTIRNEEDVVKTYRLVGMDEVDVSRGDISWSSPIGKSLLNSKVGDAVTIQLPKGEVEFEVIKIKYV
ncbi:MAG: transcription elongation factor GreB [Xanthomonadaceae bacterium]|nr:transcription elongation factor GreB [Xanthomonadaceae bacterium]